MLFCTAGCVGSVGRRECAWLIVADGRFVFVCLSVAIMHWTREERSFCVEAYFSNAHSIIAVQRAFRLRYDFHLSGCLTKQNMRYWSETNPRELHQRPLHSDRVTVCCAISRVGIICPYFFQDNWLAVTVNSERYLTMIQDFFQPALVAMQLEDTWFQQDGATAHTARVTMNCLRQMFPCTAYLFEG